MFSKYKRQKLGFNLLFSFTLLMIELSSTNTHGGSSEGSGEIFLSGGLMKYTVKCDASEAETRQDKTCGTVSLPLVSTPIPPHCPDPVPRHRSRNTGAGATQLPDILRGVRISEEAGSVSIFHATSNRALNIRYLIFFIRTL